MEKYSRNPEYGDKSQLLREELDELGMEYLQYISSSSHHPGALQLALEGPDKQRILVQRVDPLRKNLKSGIKTFFADTCVTIFPGQMENPSFERIDYNYGQYKPNELRYREIIGDAILPPDVTFGKDAHTINNIGALSLKRWYNVSHSLGVQAFEEQYGYNNYVATDEQIDSLRDMLQCSVVLDPKNDYQRVE